METAQDEIKDKQFDRLATMAENARAQGYRHPPADWTAEAAELRGSYVAPFLLGRAIPILEGLVESPTDALDIQLARDLLADYRKWMERE